MNHLQPVDLFLASFIVFLFVPICVRYIHGKIVGWALAIFPLLLFLYFISLIPATMGGKIIKSSLDWFPALGINFLFYIDGLSLLFALLISGIGIFIVIYSAYYLEDHSYLSRYYNYLFFFMLSMLGLILANNLIIIFIFWELTSIASYLLIGFNHEQLKAREAATQALFITSLGGLALLICFILIGVASQTYNLSEIMLQGSLLQHSSSFIIILILMLLGSFTKSAQFPFHFWLPNAMEAPTPVSAYLHSATMVQVGIYLLARFHPLLSQSPWWFFFLTIAGAITMMGGAVLAIIQTDMKLILAYTTMTALGSLIFLLGSPHEMVIKAAVSFLVAHALYKATLFMVVGDIQHQIGTRDIREVGGLYRSMPITFMAVIVAGASMAGIPPLLGFYVKELFYEANLAIPVASQILTFIVVVSNMITAMMAFSIIFRPFFGKRKPNIQIKEANINMSINALFLAVITLIFSIFPFVLNRIILSPAASAILNRVVVVELTLWHGFTPSLALSCITLLGAMLLYLKRNFVKNCINYFRIVLNHGPNWFYNQLIQKILDFANFQTMILQNGKLRIYLAVIFMTVAGCSVGGLMQQPIFSIFKWPASVNIFALFLAIWILVTAFATLWVQSYFVGLIFLGLFGSSVALFFVINAAPDVAMTQVLIETLIIIMVVLNFSRHPMLSKIKKEKMIWRAINITISLVIGFSFTVLLLIITDLPFSDKIGNYFLENSRTLGHGSNVVNVILVDFRSFDTLGEIIVIAVSALGVFGLIKKKFSNEDI